MIGYEYFVFKNTVWRKHHHGLIPLSMPHRRSGLSRLESKLLLMRKKAAFIRWDEDFGSADGSEWWHVVKDSQESLDSLSGSTRSKIRRGLKRFNVRLASREEVMRCAYQVYAGAFERYFTFEEKVSEIEFQNSIALLPEETEFFVAIDKTTGKLAAFSENLVADNACFYLSIWFLPEALRSYVGYALIHEMNKHYLNDKRLHYVSDGARSISHQTNIHSFLCEKFAFRKEHARLQVVYAPGIDFLIWILYPFRSYLARASVRVLQKLAVLLEQERIRRACQATVGVP